MWWIELNRGSRCRGTLVEVGEPQLFVGCCGWTEAQSRYLTNFRTIELQTTFYEPPTSAVAKRWRSQAPPGFRFCMKAWQLITHTPSSPTYRRLRAGVSPEERRSLRQLSADGTGMAGLGAHPRNSKRTRCAGNCLPVPEVLSAHTRKHPQPLEIL